MFNGGFGDAGHPISCDEDDQAADYVNIDYVNNEIFELPNLPLMPATHHENNDSLICELAALPSSVCLLPKKRNKRRATLMVDVDTEIPSKVMKARISE